MPARLRFNPSFGARLSIVEAVAAFAVLLAAIVTLQALCGAYSSGFGGDNDEAAHLINSLMARDFIAGLDFRHPLLYARQYYYHYPKVTIGLWPPGFYAALGVWFLIVGASRVTALMFIAIISAATASLIYLSGRQLIGRWAGALASVLFVASPLVQESSALVMTEHLTTLEMLVSTLCFARFVKTGRLGDGVAFGCIATAAIMTHGNAWALGLVPGITLALTNRWYLLRRPGLWLAAVPVLVICVPWYAWAPSEIGFRGGGLTSLLAEAAPLYISFIYDGVGLPVLMFASIGAWATVIRVTPRASVAPEWAAFAALAIATFILHCILPVPIQSRFMVLLLPSVVLYSAAGVNEIAGRLGAGLRTAIFRVGLALLLVTVCFADSFALPVQLGNGGYQALARDVVARVSRLPQVWLISSDSSGEGSLVSAVALQETRPSSYILRARKILGGGDLYWRNMQDRFDTMAKLSQLLDDMPVTIIVIDDQISPEAHRHYQDRLRKLVADEKHEWALIGSYPQVKNGMTFSDSLHVYARRPIASLANAAPALRLDRLRALMTRKELR